MKHLNTTAEFYRSPEWQACKEQVLHERIKQDGSIICEFCNKPILKGFNSKANNNSGAIVFHHKTFLNNNNINDAAISINPANIQILHWRCHNEIHQRFGFNNTNNIPEKKVFIITGAPYSGRHQFVKERIEANDILIDTDSIWHLITGQEQIKSKGAKPLIFATRDHLKELVARGTGTWRNAYIIESLPIAIERNREAERYKAINTEIITIDTSKEECIKRLQADNNIKDKKEIEGFINEYFKRFI